TNQDLLADLCAEQAQQPSAKSIGDLRGTPEERGLRQPPYLDGQGGAAAQAGGNGKQVQPMEFFFHVELRSRSPANPCPAPWLARVAAARISSVLMPICQ